MPDLLGIGTSGLLSYQRALTTTSHNISNVNTEGYSRQRASLGTRIPEFIGIGYAGSGVRVMDISRNYDNFLASQLRTQTSNNEYFNSFHALASQIDNMLADQNAGLGPMLDEFFAATQGVADNPNSIPARQVLLTSAESLSDRFHYLDQRLRDLNSRVNQQLNAAVTEVNAMAEALAQLNKEIVIARGAAGGAEPNDLLDRRDLLINQLSELVDVKTVEQQDGMMNVFIGSGQGLVVGANTLRLDVRPDDLIQGKSKIVLDDGSGGVDITRLLKGGKIGGTLAFSDSILEESRNAMGRIAAGISEQFNALHAMGIDLNGELGGNFFRPFIPQVFSANGNSATGIPTVAYDDVTLLTTNDYLLEFDGANWNLSDYKTGQNIPFTDPGVVQGIFIDTATVAGAAAGDRFLIRPTSEAARLFGVAIDDPTKIAAAGALLGSEATDGNGLPVNQGTGAISAVAPADNSNLPLPGEVRLSYDAALQQYTITGADQLSIPYNPQTDAGQTQTITVGGMAISFILSGLPQDGDALVIDNNTNAVGDNRNALALAGLQTQRGLIGGTATYQAAYGQMVSRVGTQTHQAEINKAATSTLRNQAEMAMQSVSGVNLDEEAANLIKFQQAYQANAQIISIANQLFQTLLQAF